MSVHVDGGALWRDLMTMGAIGATARGGSYRTALSDADRDARNLFVLWAKDANLSVTIDRIGEKAGLSFSTAASAIATWRKAWCAAMSM